MTKYIPEYMEEMELIQVGNRIGMGRHLGNGLFEWEPTFHDPIDDLVEGVDYIGCREEKIVGEETSPSTNKEE